MRTIQRYLDLTNEVNALEEKLNHAKWLKEQAEAELKIGVTRSGYRGDSEHWTNWWVFPSTMSDEKIEERLPEIGVDGGHYSGAGQSYSHHYTMLRRGSRVLVEQSGGLDI
jgi:hypothetical protein